MENSNANTQNAQALAAQASKFQTVNAAKAWWNSLSPQQKGAFVGVLAASAMGGYVVYATYGAIPLSQSIWGGILYGSAAGACVGGIAAMAFTPKTLASVKSNLKDI